MSFKNIINQEVAKSVLKSAIKENKVHHSYLFFGPEGSGKKSTALEFAKALNCPNIKDGEPCDSCSYCRRISQNNHPDVISLSPSGVKQAISIDAIRGIEHFAQLKSFEAKYKVVLLERPERLRKEAGNCFLKTLEEPPRNVVIILLSAFPDKILPTIFSRCQKLKFFALSPAEGIAITKDKFNLAEDSASMLYFVCSGRAKWMKLWLDADLWSLREEIFNCLEMLLKDKTDYEIPLKLAESMIRKTSDFADRIKREQQEAVDELDENLSSAQMKEIKALKQAEAEELKKELTKIIFSIIKSFYADMFSASHKTAFIINKDKEDFIAKRAKDFPHSYLDSSVKEIENSFAFLESGANEQLLFQSMCINLFCGAL
jgi:DNA polymerase-3 subunit delta'